jgi:hypothetical protein
VAAACLVAGVVGALVWWSPQFSVADARTAAGGLSARVVNVSNV